MMVNGHPLFFGDCKIFDISGILFLVADDQAYRLVNTISSFLVNSENKLHKNEVVDFLRESYNHESDILTRSKMLDNIIKSDVLYQSFVEGLVNISDLEGVNVRQINGNGNGILIWRRCF